MCIATWLQLLKKHARRSVLIVIILCTAIYLMRTKFGKADSAHDGSVVYDDFPGCYCDQDASKWTDTLNKMISRTLWLTCTDPRTLAAGAGQKVVSFSLFHGPKSDPGRMISYTDGVIENMDLMNQVYPGWYLRVYHNYSYNSTACKVLCSGRNLHPSVSLCYVVDLPFFPSVTGVLGRLWRYLPMIDAKVDVFLSRDTDSHVGGREAAAVQEWLQIGSTLHVMRDHPAHGTPILAGMWGTSVAMNANETINENRKRRFNLRRLAIEIFEEAAMVAANPPDDLDQQVLANVITPYFTTSGDYVDHSSFVCNEYGFKSRPFPTRRDFSSSVHLVGGLRHQNYSSLPACPVQCRPVIEWEYC